MDKYRSLQQQAFEANLELPDKGLVIETFGNVSAFDKDSGVFAIKPSGVPYPELIPENMVVLDLDNRIVSGKLKPSSDTPTHMELYRHFGNIGGICHTHSSYATAWAQAGKSIPVMGTTHADLVKGDIPCTAVISNKQIEKQYEVETGKLIVDTFTDISPADTPMVLVARHGPFTWGKSAKEAVYHSVMLEELARIAFYTLQINPRTRRLKTSLIEKHFQRKHGPDAYYGQDDAIEENKKDEK
ncbi:MAG: L-ribulose-5-phosphate 4-epimerase AraD [bacterium]